MQESSIVGMDVGCHYDEVCVVQLASGRRGLVLDALALQDMMWDLLQPLLSDDRVCKIFRGHCSDLHLLQSQFSIAASPPRSSTPL